MVAYEFYWRDEIGKEHLVGILPERRKNLLRITKESILNWVSLVIGDNLESNNIYFVQVEMWNLQTELIWNTKCLKSKSMFDYQKGKQGQRWLCFSYFFGTSKTFYLKFNVSSDLTFHEHVLTPVFPCFTRYFLLKSHYKSADRVFESPLPCHGLQMPHSPETCRSITPIDMPF